MTSAFKIIDSFDAYLKVVHEEFPRINGRRLYYRGQGKRAEEGFDLKPSVARYPHLEKLSLAEREYKEAEVLEILATTCSPTCSTGRKRRGKSWPLPSTTAYPLALWIGRPIRW